MEILFVRNGNGLQTEKAIVFNDHDPRPDGLDGLPNPVFVSIDVDRKKSDVFRKTGLLKEGINILSRNPGALGLEVKFPVDSVCLDKSNVGLARVQYHPLPMILEQKKPGIAFLVIFDTKLDEGLIWYRNMADQILNNAVLVPL